MSDRSLVAYRLIENTLRKHGLPVNSAEVDYVLNRMNLPEPVKLDIALVGIMERGNDRELALAAAREWRNGSLSRNPFA